MVTNFLLKMLAGALQGIAMLLHGLLKSADLSIDNLVFKTTGEGFGVLTLFKVGEAQRFLATFYNVFNYIAIAMFIPIILWTTNSITKAGDSPQHKSMMKDRLTKIILTFCLLYTMPELLALLTKLSNGFVTIFETVGYNFIQGTSFFSIVDNFMEPLSLADWNIAHAVSALILVGVNIWMISFYIIRDLTVAFLFLIFPIIAIWHPFNTGMTKNWWVAMAGNILAQPIQALVLTLVLSLSSVFQGSESLVGEGPGFAHSLYTIIAFSSIVPMTGLIKGLLGLESGIGAGNSKAGLGGAMGAIMLARGMARGVEGSLGDIREGKSMQTDATIESTELQKNLSPSGKGSSSREDISKPLQNPSFSTRGGKLDTSTPEGKQERMRELDAKRRAGKTQVARGVASMATGAVGAITMGAIGAGMGGGLRGAAQFGMAGYVRGQAIGGSAAALGYDTLQGTMANMEMESDISSLQNDIALKHVTNEIKEAGLSGDYTKNDLMAMTTNKLNEDEDFANETRVQAENKYLGLDHKELDGTKWQSQERQARMTSMKRSNLRTTARVQELARLDYAKLTPAKKSPEELRNMKDAHIYQDREKSIVYREGAEGAPEILAVGQGDLNLSEPINNPVSFGGEPKSMAGDFNFKIQSDAKLHAEEYMNSAFPNLTEGSQEYNQVYNEQVRDYTREARLNYKDNLSSMQENLNISNMNIHTDETRLQDLVKTEKERQVERQEREVQRRKEEARKVAVHNKVFKEIDTGGSMFFS